jgi:hypothetical protein
VRLQPRLFLPAAYAVAVCSVAVAQTPNSESKPPEPPVLATLSTTCNPWIIQTLPTELSFRQRACFSLAELVSPGRFAEAAAGAGYSQWRNSPRINPDDADDFGTRFAHIYERQAARATAELLVGYLHNEDPRLHFSNAHGAVNRTRAALLSVLTSPGEDGHARPAFAPIAGALGSGLSSMALYEYQNSLAYGFERSGISYGFYFVRSVIHEFSPEIWSLAPPFIKKRREALRKVFTL